MIPSSFLLKPYPPSSRNAGVVSAFVLLALLSVAGCSGEEAPEVAPPASAPPAEDASATAAPGQGGAATAIHLEITGGPQAGTYDVTSERVTCSDGAAGEGIWGNQYYEPEQEGLTSLQLIVPDVQSAASGTGVFNVGVDVGGEKYRVDTRPGFPNEGGGTVTVNRSASPATVEIDARTESGVELRGTITCYEVLRP